MSWTKLSDDFSDDCWSLSDHAFRLHVEGLCWSNRKLLDLELDDEDLRRFAKHPEAVEELIAVGWWSREGDRYIIRHHAGYQRSKEQVLKLQEVATKNGRMGGRPPREQTPKNPAANPAAKPRDNPQGQARTGQGSKTGPTARSWPELRKCEICNGPMDAALSADWVCHPNCSAAA